MFLTSGSSIGVANDPIWCANEIVVDKPLFKWNANSGGIYSGAQNKSYIYIYLGNFGSYLKNDVDSGLGYPLCET
jgi:hypothetical protein